MLRLPAIVSSCALVCAVAVSQAHAAERATASVSVNVHIASRTSLKVSSQVLQFNVLEAGDVATASIDFSAGARVPAGGEVVLTVERLHSLDGRSGATDGETTVTFAGIGAGVTSGTIRCDEPSVAGRWQGSGKREGRLVFTMRASAARSYSVPVRFVLSTP